MSAARRAPDTPLFAHEKAARWTHRAASTIWSSVERLTLD
jgi:hypothetical protein